LANVVLFAATSNGFVVDVIAPPLVIRGEPCGDAGRVKPRPDRGVQVSSANSAEFG
jgi:nitrous oxidase accessory protein NosD